MNTICTVEGKRHSLVTIHRNKKKYLWLGVGERGGRGGEGMGCCVSLDQGAVS